MRIRTQLSSLVAILILLSSCEWRGKPPVEYFNYLESEESGMMQIRNYPSKNLAYAVQYRTPEYDYLKEVAGVSFPKEEELEERKAETSGYYIEFRISSFSKGYDKIKDTLLPKDYTDRIAYMSGAMSADFKLLEGADTLYTSFYHFERTYNLTPYNSLLLGFESEANSIKDLTLIYDDQVFGTGIQKFTISRENLKNLPKLKL